MKFNECFKKYSVITITLLVSSITLAGQNTFIDSCKNTVTSNANKSIINVESLIPSFITFNGVDSLKGIPHYSKINSNNGVQNILFPKFKDIPSITSTNNGLVPNFEDIVKKKPTFFVQYSNWMPEKLLQPYIKAGVNTYCYAYGSHKSTLQSIKDFGVLFNQSKKADDILNYDKKIEEFIATNKIKNKLSALSISRYSKETFSPFRIKSIQANYVTNTGAIWASQSESEIASIPTEELLNMNPDVIFLGNYSPAVPNDLYTNQLLAKINAVKNKRIYKVPVGMINWDLSSQETPLMSLWTRTLLEPSTVSKNLRAEIKSRYKVMYNKDISDKNINIILNFKENNGSNHYNNFFKK